MFMQHNLHSSTAEIILRVNISQNMGFKVPLGEKLNVQSLTITIRTCWRGRGVWGHGPSRQTHKHCHPSALVLPGDYRARSENVQFLTVLSEMFKL